MKKLRLIITLILASVMLLSCVPDGNPSTGDSSTDGLTDTSSVIEEESNVNNDKTLLGYLQYESKISDPEYLKGDVKYAVYYDKATATPTLRPSGQQPGVLATMP